MTVSTRFWNALLPSRDDWIIAHCTGKSVLHLGCTDWPLTEARLQAGRLLHQKLAMVTSSLTGVDADAEGIKKLRELMPGLPLIASEGESMHQHPELNGKRFDVILAADVVEHVSNVGQFLNSCRLFMGPDTELVITTPSAFSLKRFAYWFLAGREHVHPDHIAYFSHSTLEQHLKRSGLILSSIQGFQWVNPTPQNQLANALVWLPLHLSRGRVADEIAVVAKLG
jgi:2-polyprenyl-3-methyl-5-hydroxy-6-metoxy-1,4-benzoquinol methylase